ncbi:hypothetical protein HYY69_04110 [Candidatus Woesearchaeota archaeon]|nr:hypothetical protein [Candidatus Woesearchaeota archaeon]
MPENPSKRDDKERVVKFALLIQQTFGADKGIQYYIESQNQGIADAEIILIVEAWLEKVKKKYKDNMMGGFSTGNTPP